MWEAHSIALGAPVLLGKALPRLSLSPFFLVLGRGSSQCLLFAAQFKQSGALSDYGLFWVACISQFWLKDVVHWSHTSAREGVQLTVPSC